MATVEQITEQVLDVVQDNSYDEDTVLRLINECAVSISRNLILSALDHTGTVTTLDDVAVVPLPDDFQRNLYFCRDESASRLPVTILNSRSAMIRDHGQLFNSQKGTRVFSVAAVKPFLLYAPIPVEPVTLTLQYQRKPAPLTMSSDEFDMLPAGFEDLPFYYSCWQLYSRIEQGLEGQKVDTNYYQSLYLGMRDELEFSLREGVSLPPPPIVRMERW